MLSPHFSIVKPINGNEVSSCRSPDLPYEKGKSYVTIVDGFIISDNIKAESKVIETEYKFSDHQPVTMTFTLL